MGSHGYDVVHGEIAQHAGLNLDLLRVGLPFHLVAGLQLLLGHHAQTLEHLNTFFVEITLKDLRARLLHIESSLLCFHHPFVAVAVTVEADGLTGLDIFAQYVDDGVILSTVFCASELLLELRNLSIHTFLEVGQSLGHSTVQGDHGAGAVSLGTYGTELKAVTGEGEG